MIIEVAGEILPTFDAPQWVNQTFVLFLVLGFPLALVLAWAFEMTPEGIKAGAEVQPAQSTVQSTDRKLIYAILGLVLIAVGFQVTDRFLFNGQQLVTQAPAAAPLSQNSSVIRFSVPVGKDADLYLDGVASATYGIWEFRVKSCNGALKREAA